MIDSRVLIKRAIDGSRIPVPLRPVVQGVGQALGYTDTHASDNHSVTSPNFWNRLYDSPLGDLWDNSKYVLEQTAKQPNYDPRSDVLSPWSLGEKRIFVDDVNDPFRAQSRAALREWELNPSTRNKSVVNVPYAQRQTLQNYAPRTWAEFFAGKPHTPTTKQTTQRLQRAVPSMRYEYPTSNTEPGDNPPRPTKQPYITAHNWSPGTGYFRPSLLETGAHDPNNIGHVALGPPGLSGGDVADADTRDSLLWEDIGTVFHEGHHAQQYLDRVSDDAYDGYVHNGDPFHQYELEHPAIAYQGQGFADMEPDRLAAMKARGAKYSHPYLDPKGHLKGRPFAEVDGVYMSPGQQRYYKEHYPAQVSGNERDALRYKVPEQQNGGVYRDIYGMSRPDPTDRDYTHVTNTRVIPAADGTLGPREYRDQANRLSKSVGGWDTTNRFSKP